MKKITLSPQELERYQRQIMIPGFAEAGQQKLKKARVLLAGAGGLGSAAALYLAAAGIGYLRIVDSDAVELSNLNRQVLHWTTDTGKHKVESAAQKLKALNPQINIEAVREKITAANISHLVAGCDLIVDALDNLKTRYFLNAAAVAGRLPLFHGAVSGFEGRAMTVIPGETPCLMCLYRGVDLKGKTPVMGATPGIIACIQATEVIKYLVGLGTLLKGRLLVYDGLNMKFTEVTVQRDPGCQVCGNNSSLRAHMIPEAI
jgi:molybdopterin/thiamine biosynthesis adenylyltransferase